MKKLITFIAIVMLGLSTTFAQTSTKSPAPIQTVKKVESKAATTPAKKKEVKKAPVSATSPKLKADGTPDMRYSENKGKKAVTAGPTKKDGTADMRYKANKPAKKN